MFRRRKGVRVRQRIRRLELWPVFKLALLFHAICGAISLGVVVLGWQLLNRVGYIKRFQSFLKEIGFSDTSSIDGAALFRGARTVTLALVLHNTLITVLLAVLYNLLSGVFGGLILSVVEDDSRPRRRAGDARRRKAATKQVLEPRSSAKSAKRATRAERKERDRMTRSSGAGTGVGDMIGGAPDSTDATRATDITTEIGQSVVAGQRTPESWPRGEALRPASGTVRENVLRGSISGSTVPPIHLAKRAGVTADADDGLDDTDWITDLGSS